MLPHFFDQPFHKNNHDYHNYILYRYKHIRLYYNVLFQFNVGKQYIKKLNKLKNLSSSVSYQNNLWNKTFTTTLYYIYIPLKQDVN